MVRVAHDGELEEIIEALCGEKIMGQDFFAGHVLQGKSPVASLERSEKPVQIRLRPFAVQLQDILEMGSARSGNVYEKGVVFGKQRHSFLTLLDN